MLAAYVSYWPHEYDFNLHRMYSMGFWSLIYKNLSCTIDDSILICKLNLKRGKINFVDRMSYRAAILNPRQARPPHCRPTASTTVGIATMFYLENLSTTSELKPFMCFKVIYACKRTFESKLCTYTPRYVLLPFLQLGP